MSVSKVDAGREKCSERGLGASRSRHNASISRLGRVEIFCTSRKEERVLMPGGGAEADVCGDRRSGGTSGAGWKEGSVDGGASGGVSGVGVSGAVAPGTAAFRRSSSIWVR